MPDVEIKGADVLNRARRVVLELRRAIEENFRHHGLDTGEFDVLATLRRAGEPYALRPTELYRSLMISSGGLTARLDRLEGAGLIRRRAAGDDARSVIVELTSSRPQKDRSRLPRRHGNRKPHGLRFERERTCGAGAVAAKAHAGDAGIVCI